MYKCTPAGVKSNQNRDQQHEQHGHDMIHKTFLNFLSQPLIPMSELGTVSKFYNETYCAYSNPRSCIINLIFCISNIGCSPYNYNAVAIWSYVTGLL